MNKFSLILTLSILLLVPIGVQSAFADTEIVFFEDFDDTLTGWSESLCNRTAPDAQTCSIEQITGLYDASEPPNSPPNWGLTHILDTGGHPDLGPIEVRHSKSFTVVNEDNYDITAWLGTKDCSGCVISTRLYVDGSLVFNQDGLTAPIGPSPIRVFFEETSLHLTSGSHDVEIGMFSTAAANGFFRASFDDINISREISLTCGTGTTLNTSTNECEADIVACAIGTTLNTNSKECEPDVTQDDLDLLQDIIDNLNNVIIPALESTIAQLQSIISGQSDADICHKPGTNKQETMQVSVQQLQGHLNHGDTFGECVE